MSYRHNFLVDLYARFYSRILAIKCHSSIYRMVVSYQFAVLPLAFDVISSKDRCLTVVTAALACQPVFVLLLSLFFVVGKWGRSWEIVV